MFSSYSDDELTFLTTEALERMALRIERLKVARIDRRYSDREIAVMRASAIADTLREIKMIRGEK